MVVNKITKVRRQRRSRTHGWGSPKKHRGAGSRGGRGNAGAGKKGQQNVAQLRSKGITLGPEKGFKRVTNVVQQYSIINLNDIELRLETYIHYNLAKKVKDTFEIDVSALGYTKVLGYGQITTKMNIIANGFSAKAIEKIEAAGGKAVNLNITEDATESSAI
ncbi:MAG: uL15 family ribosomal protein [DPANN group archaeon]|nr:uL15 family ribosomal protein [DPANN group archaeon]